MPRESQQERSRRTARLIRKFQEVYPDAHCELEHENPFQLLIATILSAQCSDKQVNIVTADLFKKYHHPRDFAAVTLPELESDIRRIGLFRSKARNIQKCCRRLVEQHGGEVPRTMDELVSLEGVGRKTANVVLGNAFGIPSGVVVDTHVARLSVRLGLSRQKTPEKIEKDLQALVPLEFWMLFSHWLIWHGRRRCAARRPDCPHCEVRELCPTGKKILPLMERGRA